MTKAHEMSACVNFVPQNQNSFGASGPRPAVRHVCVAVCGGAGSVPVDAQRGAEREEDAGGEQEHTFRLTHVEIGYTDPKHRRAVNDPSEESFDVQT